MDDRPPQRRAQVTGFLGLAFCACLFLAAYLLYVNGWNDD